MRTHTIGRLLILCLLGIFLFQAAVQASFSESMPAQQEVRVEAHQTLWDIAAMHVNDDTDIRSYIYAIKQLNHISDAGQLQTGQILKLPACQ